MIFFLFFSSGFAALLYQAVWLKYLGLLFGNTIYATAAVLSAFMFGLAVGSWAAPRFKPLFQNGLRSYGLIEAGIGAFAAAFPFLYTESRVPFSWLFNWIGPQSWVYTMVAFACAFAILVVPTILMGASLPVLAAVVIRDRDIASKTGFLYAVNTAGAVAGIFCSAFVLIPLLGLHATIYAGVLINLLIGLVCFLVPGSALPALREPSSMPRHPLLTLYLFSGLLALGYEVLWTRILVLHMGSSVHAYAIMLSVFLLGISLGSAVAGRLLDRTNSSPETVFGILQAAWALSILLQILQFSSFSDTLFFLASSFKQLDYGTYLGVLFSGACLVLLLPTMLSGALFPVVVKAVWNRGEPIESASSAAYSSNTVGGIFGSVVAAFLLIPTVGTQGALVVFAAANLVLGWLALASTDATRIRKWMGAATLIFVGSAVLLMARVNVLRNAGIFRSEGKDQLIKLEEDSAATISVEKRMYLNQPYLSLSINGVNVAGSSPQLVSIQKMQGNLPMMLYGTGKSARVLHIGFGSGGTAYSVSLYPQSEITVVELSRAVVHNADESFRSENHGIVSSGRLHFIYFDGRSYLQNTRATYDLILSDSIHPRYSGNGSLYTKDYYELVSAHLNDDGVHSQWIPIYSMTAKNLREILRAFSDVFPETYVWYINRTINPYIVVTGRKKAGISYASLLRGFGDPAVASDLRSVGAMNPYSVLDYFLFGPAGVRRYVADVDPHVDDLLSVEYESARVLNKVASWRVNFEDLLRFREPVVPYLVDTQGFDESAYRNYYEASTFSLKGQLEYLSEKKQEAVRDFKAARARNPQDADPYEYSTMGLKDDARK